MGWVPVNRHIEASLPNNNPSVYPARVPLFRAWSPALPAKVNGGSGTLTALRSPMCTSVSFVNSQVAVVPWMSEGTLYCTDLCVQLVFVTVESHISSLHFLQGLIRKCGVTDG